MPRPNQNKLCDPKWVVSHRLRNAVLRADCVEQVFVCRSNDAIGWDHFQWKPLLSLPANVHVMCGGGLQAALNELRFPEAVAAAPINPLGGLLRGRYLLTKPHWQQRNQQLPASQPHHFQKASSRLDQRTEDYTQVEWPLEQAWASCGPLKLFNPAQKPNLKKRY